MLDSLLSLPLNYVKKQELVFKYLLLVLKLLKLALLI